MEPDTTTHDPGGAKPLDWRAMMRPPSLKDALANLILIPPLFLPVAWGLYALVDWLPGLYWAVVIAVGCVLLLFFGALSVELATHIKRRDTATQTLRAASQGRIEVIGTLRRTADHLVSPLYGVDCIGYSARFDARPVPPPGTATTTGGKRRDVILFSESSFPPAVLMVDGPAEAFLSFEGVHRHGTEIELLHPEAPRDLLRADIRDRLVDGDWTITLRQEALIPTDMPIQLNGVFRTLSSQDSYLEAVRKQTGLRAPTKEELDASPVEQAWRTYCARREDAAGTSGPVPVDAVVPITDFKRHALVRVTDAGGRASAKIAAILVLMLLPFLYLALRLLDVMKPLPLLF